MILDENILCPPCEKSSKNKLIIPRKQGLLKYRTWNDNTHEIIELLNKKNPIEVKKDDRFNRERYEKESSEYLENVENESKNMSMLSHEKVNEINNLG